MEQKTTSVVMLGAGYIGQNHALSLRVAQFARGGGRVSPRLHCLIETPAGEASGKETANRFGFEEVTTRDWTEVLSSTECDLFLNAGPNKAHVEPSIGFARAGKHVFCEKPLARTADEAFRAWQEVAAAGVKRMCAFVHRFIPAIQLAREIIRAGELGDILHYRSRFLLDMRNPDRSISWRFTQAESGAGAMGDLGSHHIDVVRFLRQKGKGSADSYCIAMHKYLIAFPVSISIYSFLWQWVSRRQRPTDKLSRGDRYSGAPWATRSPVIAQHGMAATEQPLASLLAIDILKKGGSAVDAAIAANAAIGLMQPVLNGIGGDLFAIVWDPKTKQVYGYNGSGRAPMGRDLAKMTAEVEAAWKKAGEAVSGAYSAHRLACRLRCPARSMRGSRCMSKFGKLPMADDLAPAIGYATNGFPVTQLIALYWKGNMAAFEKNKALIEEFDNARATYLIDGRTPEEGEIFRNPDLAHTLTLIAKGGRDAYYKGPIAHTIDAYFKRIGGDLRYEDFAAHHGEWVTPLSVNYRGYDVHEIAAQRPGRRRSADAADPERLRPQEDGRRLRRHADGHARSETPRL